MSQNRPDYSWANYLDYMEGGGSDVLAFRAATSPFKGVEEKKDLPLWGVLAAVGVTIIAILLSELPFWPFTISGKHPIEPVMLAIVLGMVLSNVWTLPKSLQSGIKFSVKKILPVGIVLLGARLDFFIMQRVGLRGLCFSLIETIVALLLLAFLVRVLKLPGKLGTLLGVALPISGAQHS